jgi:hypothetical protein
MFGNRGIPPGVAITARFSRFEPSRRRRLGVALTSRSNKVRKKPRDLLG